MPDALKDSLEAKGGKQKENIDNSGQGKGINEGLSEAGNLMGENWREAKIRSVKRESNQKNKKDEAWEKGGFEVSEAGVHHIGDGKDKVEDKKRT